MKRLRIKLTTAALCIAMAPAMAADFVGFRPLICSAIEAKDCAVGLGCLNGLAEEVNVPQFIRLDFSGKTISARGRTSKMPNHILADGLLTIQGIEHSRAFSITISEQSGNLADAIAGDEEDFVIFGACTTL